MSDRREQLQRWLREALGDADFTLAPASSDASFRHYLRVRHGGETRIVMDAPPDKEDSRPFVAVAGLLGELGLNVPRVLAADLEQGFLLLTDLGSRHYLDVLNESNVERLYGDAMQALLRMQSHAPPPDASLPACDRALLMREMELFREWFLQQYLGCGLAGEQHAVLDACFELLADSALAQPTVVVHRDYHSRNLMVTEPNPGVLDFQDAVMGPVTYDLVSLLRDCYIAWPRARVEAWAAVYRDEAAARGIIPPEQAGEFMRWFDLMGVQRHLKAIGIFARLNIRDGKPGYLGDIPRTLDYVLEVAVRYEELAPLHGLLAELGVAERCRNACVEGAG